MNENYDTQESFTTPDKSYRKIGTEEVRKANLTLAKYKEGKINLEKRIIENDRWWKMQHWGIIGSQNPSDPRPASAWLFNCISNKHADAMDNFPKPCVLPREGSDKADAQILSQILPVILEYNDFEQTYSDAWWYKLKTGTGCYGVFWNPSLENGLGNIDIRQLDLLNMFWESGIRDIQESRNLFTVELADNDVLISRYPFLSGKLGTSTVDVAKYVYDDNVDTESKSAVIDWYYKKIIDGKEVVHYCKYVGDTVLYASENDPLLFEKGFYDHGKYPVVLDVLFRDEGTPCGFGYIDIMKDVQMYIDKLNQIILKNTLQSGRRRFFISDNSGINEEEFADWSKEFVHTSGSLDERNIKEITVSQLDGSVITLLAQKIDELKETTGNRDVSQGGTLKGVTAASAIAALQEAGNKSARDMIKSSYRAFKKINYMIIELIRQFYDEPRYFRVMGADSDVKFLKYTNQSIKETSENADSAENIVSARVPVFDVYVVGEKDNPFSVSIHNELAKELYNLGMFNPEKAHEALICLEMMNFDGKQEIMEKIRENYMHSKFAPPQFNPELPSGYISDSPEALSDNSPGYSERGFKKAFPGKSIMDTARERSKI